MKFHLVIALLGLVISNMSAETLDVLVLEVDQRLIGPTIERALSPDPAALADAISKMRQLSPDKGVRERLSLEIERSNPEEPAENENFSEATNLPEGMPRTSVGTSHRWGETGNRDLRRLKLHEIQSPESIFEIEFEFYHQPSPHWTLAGGVATPKGAIFVFEMLRGGDPVPNKPGWVISCLLDKKPGNNDKSAINAMERPPIGRAAILRVAEPQTLSSATDDKRRIRESVKFNQGLATGYDRGFSESFVEFVVEPQRTIEDENQTKPVGARAILDLIDSRIPSGHVTHELAMGMPLEEDYNTVSAEATYREKTREGTRTSSIPSKSKKPAYHLQSFLLTP